MLQHQRAQRPHLSGDGSQGVWSCAHSLHWRCAPCCSYRKSLLLVWLLLQYYSILAGNGLGDALASAQCVCFCLGMARRDSLAPARQAPALVWGWLPGSFVHCAPDSLHMGALPSVAQYLRLARFSFSTFVVHRTLRHSRLAPTEQRPSNMEQSCMSSPLYFDFVSI